MTRRIPLFHSALAIFLSTALVAEPAAAQVQVYVKKLDRQYDLRKVLPGWVEVVGSPQRAEWIIDYEVTKSIVPLDRSMLLFGDGFIRGGAFGFVWGGALGASMGAISEDIPPLESCLFWGTVTAVLWGAMMGIGQVVVGGRAFFNENKPNVPAEKVTYFDLTVESQFSTLQRSLSTSSRRFTSDISRILREMAGDRSAPSISVRNLTQQTRRTIKGPVFNLDIKVTDDVELSVLEVEIGQIPYQIGLTGQKTFEAAQPYPLDVGDNTIKATATDLYGRSTGKSYHVLRAPGPAAVLNAELLITRGGDNIRSGPTVRADVVKKCSRGAAYPVLDYSNGWFKIRADAETSGWIYKTSGELRSSVVQAGPVAAESYPPLLSIGDISFNDESNDGFLDAGEGGTLSFQIVNDGKGAAGGLRLKVESPQGSGIGVSPLESPPPVSPNSSVQVKYSLIASATIPTQDVELMISALDQPSNSPAAPVSTTIKTRGRWSDVDLDIPRARRPNTDGVAVIIGNREYKDPGIYPVEYALSDAEVMKKYVMQALGFKEENVIYLQNASYSDLRSIFGTESDPQGRLHNLIFPDRSDVFVYYSGHGVPGLKDQRGYLLPANVKAGDAQKSGYSLELLGRNLAQLPAKSVTLVVDACFSGQGEEGSLIRGASPVYIVVTDPFLNIKNGNSFFASGGKEIASWFPEQKHGLFTYYFLKGLRGEADTNGDKRVTAAELEKFLSETVPYKVRRLTGRSQNPVITATEKDRVLARY